MSYSSNLKSFLPQHHLRTIDPESVLGLSEDSIQCYSIGDQRRQVGNALLPPVTPYQAVSTNNDIKILMKGKYHFSLNSYSFGWYRVYANKKCMI